MSKFINLLCAATKRLLSAGISLLLLLALAAGAECPDMSSASPARIATDAVNLDRIGKLVRNWKGDDQVRIINAAVYVDNSGHIDGVCCSSSSFPMTFVLTGEIFRKIRRLRFEPATHLGGSLNAYVIMTIVAVRSEDGVETNILLNQRQMIDELGTGYTAPQRIYKRRIYPFGTTKGNYPQGEIEARIDQYGQSSDVRVLSAGPAPRSVQRMYIDTIERSCFVPGFHNGSAIAMPYRETMRSHSSTVGN